MSKTNIGIIGAGSFACRYHIPELLKRDDCELTAIAKRDEHTRKLVQDKFNVPCAYHDYRDMLNEIDLDGVIICTPHHLHYEHVKTCLEHKVPVLVEKPLTIRVDEAKELTEISKKMQVPLLAAYNRRVDYAYREAEKIIAEGGIGELRFIEGRRFTPLGWMLAGEAPPTEAERDKWWPDGEKKNFRAEMDSMGEGFLDDGGTHIIDAVLWLSGSLPKSVQALINKNEAGLEIRSTLNIQMENDLLASIVCCGDAQPIIPYEVIIHGSEGALLLAKETIQHQRNGKAVTINPSFEHTSTTLHFVDVIQKKSPILTPAETAILPIQVARAAFESARSGNTVSV